MRIKENNGFIIQIKLLELFVHSFLDTVSASWRCSYLAEESFNFQLIISLKQQTSSIIEKKWLRILLRWCDCTTRRTLINHWNNKKMRDIELCQQDENVLGHSSALNRTWFEMLLQVNKRFSLIEKRTSKTSSQKIAKLRIFIFINKERNWKNSQKR